MSEFNIEQRRNKALRRLIVTGNCLSLWAGRVPGTPKEHEELNDLFNAWECAVDALRKEQPNTNRTRV